MDLPLAAGPLAAWLAAAAIHAVSAAAALDGCTRASGAECVHTPDGDLPWSHVVAVVRKGAHVDLAIPVPGDPDVLGTLWDGRPGARVLVAPGASASSPEGESTVLLIGPGTVGAPTESTEWVMASRTASTGSYLRTARSGSEAARVLSGAIRAATADLSALGLDRASPSVHARLDALDAALSRQSLPSVLRSPDLIVRATRILVIGQTALDDDGAAVTGHEMESRTGVLRDLMHAARRALAAAYVDVGTVRA